MESPARTEARAASNANVLAVLVNWRTAPLALRALEALAIERVALPSLTAVVVDNASGDGSAERLRAGIAERGYDWVRVVESPSNVGFGAGNNLAVREALEGDDPPEAFLLVNPDVEVYPGAVTTLLRFLRERPSVGLVGPATEVPRGTLRGSAFRFPGILNSFDQGLHFGPVTRLLARWTLVPPPSPDAHRAHWVSGGCVLVRREVFEEVGLFDEAYFLYFEEVDLMRRAGTAGWSTWYVPSARVAHDAGAATGASGDRGLERPVPRYWFESRRRYFVKNRGRLVAALASWAWVIGNALWNARRFVTRAPRKDPPHFFRDFVSFNLLGRRAVGRVEERG